MPSHHLDGDTWLNQNWMFLGPFIGAFIMWRAFQTPKIVQNKLLLLAWALMPIYSIHQLEEHGYDLFGRRYAFIDYFFENVATKTGISPEVFNTNFITFTNVVIVWLPFNACALWAERSGDFIPVTMCWGISFCNGALFHLIPALSNQQYNPGVAQALLINIPVGVMFFRELGKVYGQHAKRILFTAFIVGGPIVHGLLTLLPLKHVSDGLYGANTCKVLMVLEFAGILVLSSKLLASKPELSKV